MKVFIYYEHTAKGPRKQKAAAGYLISFTDSKGLEATKTAFLLNEETTPHEIELQIFIKAMESMKKPCEIEIISNSTYIENAMAAGWIARWMGNGWKNTKGEEVKHADLWKRILELMAPHRVKFTKNDNGYQNWLTREVERKKDESI